MSSSHSLHCRQTLSLICKAFITECCISAEETEWKTQTYTKENLESEYEMSADIDLVLRYSVEKTTGIHAGCY